jgi:hypothetical protein
MFPGVELTSVPTSVAFIFPVGRVKLIISLSLAITARRLVNWPTARGGEKERSKPFRSLLNSDQHCARLPRRSHEPLVPCKRCSLAESNLDRALAPPSGRVESTDKPAAARL